MSGVGRRNGLRSPPPAPLRTVFNLREKAGVTALAITLKKLSVFRAAEWSHFLSARQCGRLAEDVWIESASYSETIDAR